MIIETTIAVFSVFLYAMLKSKKSTLQKTAESNFSSKDDIDKAIKKVEKAFSIDDVSSDYYVFEDDSLFVHGVKRRKQSCIEWAQGNNHKLEFKREQNNKYDSNAIAIYGISSTGKRKIGYVAADVADELVYQELEGKIKPRLLNVEIKDTPFIEYEILVKK